MADSDYRAHPGIPQSSLKQFSRSPAHFKHALTHKRPRTPAMTIGLVTESLVFGTPFLHTTSPFDSLRSKEAQNWLAQQDDRGVTVISQDDAVITRRMADAVRSNPVCAPFLSKGRSQVGMFADFTLGDTIQRKGLADWVSDSHLVIADLKTTGDASPREFSKTIYSYRYDVQAAYYLDLFRDAQPESTGETATETELRTFVFIAVERDEPHAVGVYVLDSDSVNSGRRQYIEWLELYMRCRKNESWPGYTTSQPEFIGLPKWVKG